MPLPRRPVSASLALLVLAACAGGSGGETAIGIFPFASVTGLSLGAPVAAKGVVLADFDRDGDLDLAVAGGASGDVFVAKGDGAGGFSAPASLSLGGAATAMALAAGDLDGDGVPDLAVCDDLSDRVALLRGDGAGSFSPMTNIPLAPSSGASAVVLADFDRDGRLDVAACEGATGNVRLALGTGGGLFAAAGTTSLGSGFSGTSMALLDANRNGRLDLAVASGFTGQVAVLLGTGTGAFTYGASVAVGFGASLSGVVVGDFDRDGRVDLAAGNRTTGEVAVARGRGADGFYPVVAWLMAAEVSSVAAADFDLDGNLDLVVTLSPSADVVVRLGRGDGTFEGRRLVSLPFPGGTAVATGDIDRNGSPDAAVAAASGGRAAILRGTDRSVALGFSSAATFSSGAGFEPRHVSTADANGDGSLDLVVANHGDDSVSIRLGTGAGGFGGETAVALGNGSAPVVAVTADLDSDGHADVATANDAGDGVSILWGSVFGTFSAGTPIALAGGEVPSAIVASDFDRDGRTDLAVANRNFSTVSIVRAEGSRQFATAVDFSLPFGFQPADLVILDANRDGILDLAASSGADGTVAVLLGTGTGTFAAPATFPVDAGAELAGLVAADLDRDGKPDIAVADRTAGTVAVLLGAGDGTFGAPAAFAAGEDVTPLAVADLDRDGRLDLAAALSASGRVAVLLGHGDGTFDAPVTFGAGGTGTRSLATGDFDRDGRLDFVVVNGTAANVGVLLGR